VPTTAAYTLASDEITQAVMTTIRMRARKAPIAMITRDTWRISNGTAGTLLEVPSRA
jgi:hypothetical protein